MGMAKREEEDVATLKCQSVALRDFGTDTYEAITE